MKRTAAGTRLVLGHHNEKAISLNVRHRFEHYGEANELVGYIHHAWPDPDGG
ncbi:hypothetical protein FF011L_38820 [Roseimaritima multifibrata]|uniref:Uncharacterized protein n=1 Tax=Roseimaritima multifibrata TaxID=1930274 RepID=A0A517MJQ4_9BACT|nr:hypothetical protein FF011L_38820 [Roseimaritima multifibrata]